MDRKRASEDRTGGLMERDSVQELQELIERLWAKVQLGPCIRIARSPQDYGYPHVEAARGGFYNIVITERGREIDRINLLSAMEAARWFVFQMASEHARSEELQQRTPPDSGPLLPSGLRDDGYSRWNWIAPTVEIMRRISPEFGAWAKGEYDLTLRRFRLEEHEICNARYPLPPTHG